MTRVPATAASDSAVVGAERTAASARRATPHVRELLADGLTPIGVYRRLLRLSPLRFLFESVTGGEQVSRFSFMGAAPRQVVRVYPDRLEIVPLRGGIEVRHGDPLALLHELVGGIAAAEGPIPFTGGWVGYFGYELVRLLERLPAAPRDPFALPVALLARYDTIVVFDHARQRVLAIANEIEGEVTVAAAERDLARLTRLLTAPGGAGAVAMPDEPLPVRHAQVSLDGAAFRAAVERAQEHIRAGDIFQVVLARRWRVPARVEPLALYRALRMVNPSPYMVLLETPEVALVGASPEMLVRKVGNRVETRPIAGTRPRGVDPDGDRRLAQDLLADPKERAEHVMLVDLGRNDLGRVAVPGTVRVGELMAVERYSHVMHLVSSVEADLDPRRTALDALFAAFPAGTVSGAPKIRAMEIIAGLEPEARGPYAGAVGYLSFSGDLDTCITIRTLVVRDGEVSVTAGAGIVADSQPAAEERETENKAAALLKAVGLAEQLAEAVVDEGPEA